MKRITIIFALALSFVNVQSQNLDSIVGAVAGYGNVGERGVDDARLAVLDEDFDKAMYVYGNVIDSQKRKRSQGSRVSPETMAEYAYVLALSGAQEAALINIDLALNLGWPSKTVYWYTGVILDVIGFDVLSEPYLKAGKQPVWLGGRGTELTAKYRSPVLLDINRSEEAVAHIAECLRDTRYIEALCYATCLSRLDPENQAAWLLQSAAFEKLGCYTSALQSYEKGIGLSGGSDMPGVARQRESLQKKSLKKGNSLSHWQSSSMVYGGLTYSNRSIAVNGRYGVCAGPFSMSVNMSLAFPEHGGMSYYAGLFGYYNIGKLFAGTGFGLQTFGSDVVFTFSPTVGLSFINSSRTSSFDISLAWSVPCRSGMKSTLSISFGKTFYFNINGKSK